MSLINNDITSTIVEPKKNVNTIDTNGYNGPKPQQRISINPPRLNSSLNGRNELPHDFIDIQQKKRKHPPRKNGP